MNWVRLVIFEIDRHLGGRNVLDGAWFPAYARMTNEERISFQGGRIVGNEMTLWFGKVRSAAPNPGGGTIKVK